MMDHQNKKKRKFKKWVHRKLVKDGQKIFSRACDLESFSQKSFTCFTTLPEHAVLIKNLWQTTTQHIIPQSKLYYY
jgi:hypothetical protein